MLRKWLWKLDGYLHTFLFFLVQLGYCQNQLLLFYGFYGLFDGYTETN